MVNLTVPDIKSKVAASFLFSFLLHFSQHFVHLLTFLFHNFVFHFFHHHSLYLAKRSVSE